jgi:AhpD family alkylhydroperoxidase
MLEPHLDPKTQLLVALGAAVAAKCQPCFAGLYAKAADAQVTDKEVRTAVAIGDKVAARSRGFMDAFVKDNTRGAISVRSDEPSAQGCACD